MHRLQYKVRVRALSRGMLSPMCALEYLRLSWTISGMHDPPKDETMQHMHWRLAVSPAETVRQRRICEVAKDKTHRDRDDNRVCVLDTLSTSQG